MTAPLEFYCPPDVDAAHEMMNATCGPAALAAFIGEPVTTTVKKYFPDFSGRCSGQKMEAALVLAGWGYRTAWRKWPVFGLCWLNLEGPWCAPGLPWGARLSKSHWVAVKADHVYDVNTRLWQPRPQWELEVMHPWIADTKNATGWRVLKGIEVHP